MRTLLNSISLQHGSRPVAEHPVDGGKELNSSPLTSFFQSLFSKGENNLKNFDILKAFG